jgi:hypothetical protein
MLLLLRRYSLLTISESLRSDEREDFVGSIEHPYPGTRTNGDLYRGGVSVSREWDVQKVSPLKVEAADQPISAIRCIVKRQRVPGQVGCSTKILGLFDQFTKSRTG